MTEEAIVGENIIENIVIHEYMSDPDGYSLAYDEERWFVVMCLIDGVHVGRYETRVEAIAAAEADRARRAG